MAKLLNEFEKAEIFRMARWGVCREHDILGYNAMTGRPTSVESFTLKNIPMVDALLIIGGFPRPIYHATQVLKAYEKQYGTLPELVLVGGKTTTGQELPATSEVEIVENALIEIGFDAAWVRWNHLDCKGRNLKENAEDLWHIIGSSHTLGNLTNPKIAVISEPGPMLPMAQFLSFELSRYQFAYYETPLTPEEQQTFVCERFDDGYFVDIIIASTLKAKHAGGCGKLALSDEKMHYAPSFDALRKYVDMGYCFYMTSEMLSSFGYKAEEIDAMLEKRRIEVLGMDLLGNKVGEGLKEAKPEVLAMRLQELIALTRATFFA